MDQFFHIPLRQDVSNFGNIVEAQKRRAKSLLYKTNYSQVKRGSQSGTRNQGKATKNVQNAKMCRSQKRINMNLFYDDYTHLNFLMSFYVGFYMMDDHNQVVKSKGKGLFSQNFHFVLLHAKVSIVTNISFLSNFELKTKISLQSELS